MHAKSKFGQSAIFEVWIWATYLPVWPLSSSWQPPSASPCWCRGHTTIEDIRDQIRGALPRTSCEVEDGMPAFIGERMRWHPDRPSGSGSQQDSEQCESLRFSVSFLPDASLRADHEALIFNSAGVPCWPP